MQITKALIIDTPHIDNILSGIKSWEMRSKKTKIRGHVALIRKKSGTIIGIAEITDSLEPLSDKEMLASKAKHRIDDETLADPRTIKWRFPWVMANAKKLRNPVPYEHPNGAVIWVALDDATQREVQRNI